MSQNARLPNAPKEEWSYSNIQVLRLRHNVLLQEVIKLDTIEIDHEPSQDEANVVDTTTSEKLVNHIPNVLSCEDAVFHWGSRRFVLVNVSGSATQAPGGWAMYKCNEPRAGSPLENMEKNPFFKNVKGAQAFGDVFIFKIEDYPSDKKERVRYADEWDINTKGLRTLFNKMATL